MNYVTPTVEIIRFSTTDILLTSTIDPNNKEGYESGKSSIEWELD